MALKSDYQVIATQEHLVMCTSVGESHLDLQLF